MYEAAAALLEAAPGQLHPGTENFDTRKYALLCYALRRFLMWSLPEITKRLGSRSHSTLTGRLERYKNSRTEFEKSTWEEFVRWEVLRRRREAGKIEWAEGGFIRSATPMSKERKKR